MNNSKIIELKQTIIELEAKASDIKIKLDDNKRSMIIGYVLIILGIIATIASGGLAVLLFPLIFGYLIFIWRNNSKFLKEFQRIQKEVVEIKKELVVIENS